MAKAQVEITAVDRTKAAIDSATKSLQRIESSAKKIKSRFDLAFSVITGRIVLNGFNRLADAAAKTEQGSQGFAQALDSVRASANRLFAPTEGIGGATEAMRELRDVLNDPVVINAANGIVDIMLVGFTKAATAVLEYGRTVRLELLQLGILSAKTVDDEFEVLKLNRDAALKESVSKIEQLKVTLQQLPGDGGDFGAGIRKQIEAETEVIRQTLKEFERVSFELSKVLLKEVTITSRKRAMPLENFYITEAFKQLQSQESVIRSIIDFQNKLFESVRLEIIETANLTYEELQKIEADIPDLAKQTVNQITVFAEEAAKNMQSAFANFLFDPFQDGLRGMLKGFIDTIRRMVAEFAASQILKFFFSPFTSSKGFLGTFAKYVTGERAMGGSVMGGRPYLVGERGPELFVPGSNGSVVPNNRMGGFTLAPVYNIDARGATADLQQALPGILSENNRRIFDELDRRYGIGR